tara:strand:- start:257 stop:580 length:324 start_codon:yes stop_codon:yes gene_type:complete
MKTYNSERIKKKFRGEHCLFLYRTEKNKDLCSWISFDSDSDSDFEELSKEFERKKRIIKKGYRGVSLEFASQVSDDLYILKEGSFEGCKYLKSLDSVIEDVNGVLLK